MDPEAGVSAYAVDPVVYNRAHLGRIVRYADYLRVSLPVPTRPISRWGMDSALDSAHDLGGRFRVLTVLDQSAPEAV